MDYIRAVDDYLHQPEFRYVERPPQPPVGVAPLDYFLNDSHEGYCQHFAGAMALLLRMGGLPARVATGLHAGRLLGAPQGLDRPRHRRPRLGRGLVRRLRLGHARPDAGRHAGPLAGRRAGRAAVVARRSPPTAARAPTADEGGNEPSRASARSCRLGRERRHRRPAPTSEGSLGWVRVVRARRARPGRAARVGAVPPPPARQDADGPRDRRGRGRDAPRRPPGHDRHDAEPAREPPRLALAGGRGVPPLARLGPLRAGLGARRHARAAARCAARWPRASASSGRCAPGGRCRRGSSGGRARSRACSRSRPAFAVSARRRIERIDGRGGARDHARHVSGTHADHPLRRSRDRVPLMRRSPASRGGGSRSRTPRARRRRARRAADSAARYAPTRSNGTPPYTYGFAHPPRTISSPASRAPTSTYASVRP